MRKLIQVSLAPHDERRREAKLRTIQNRHLDRPLGPRVAKLGAIALFVTNPCLFGQTALKVSIDQNNGGYNIAAHGISGPVLSAGPAILVERKWISGRDYPQH